MATEILVKKGFLWRILVMRHIRSGESQSMQTPVWAHGVFSFMLMARTGPAMNH